MKKINLPITILLIHLIVFITGMTLVYFNIQVLGVVLMIAGLPLSALISLCLVGSKMRMPEN